MATAPPVSPDQAETYFTSLQEQVPTTKQLSGLAFGPMAATTASPEIGELARALRHDPKLIYDYVHNNIEYVPYFGSLKGATLTHLDGSGNDFDQASLMIALLRASGYTAQYVYGKMTIPGADVANWLGVDVTTQTVGKVIASGGIPVTVYTDATAYMDRVWVKATIDGIDYLFDPAFKTYSTTSKIDLSVALGYNQTDFLAGATTGATVGVDYVQRMNEANIKSRLATYASNLATTIRSDHPNKAIEEIVGGRSVVQTTLAEYATTLPFPTTVTSTWDDIPDSHKTTIRIQHAGIDYTANTPDLAGKRFTLTYAGTDNHPELRLDGTLLVSGTATTIGSRNNCTVTVNHPYPARNGKYMDDDEYNKPPVYGVESGRKYAIVYNFGGVSDTLLAKLQRHLDSYMAQGLADTTEAVLGETLHLMGMTWLKEVTQSQQLLAAIAETVPIMHHNVGLMAQEAGYYIDVKAGAFSILSRHNTDTDKTAHFKVYLLIGSAFEHGILEQLTGSDKPGVSTMKLFQIANSTGSKVFLATKENYDTAIKPQLVNYTAAELTDFQNQVNSNRVLVLPDNGQLPLNQWRGNGYINKYFSGNSSSMGMIISGGYFGGYAATPGTVSPPTVTQNTKTAQTTTPTPATINLNITTTPPSTSRDPVDMAGGSFLVDHTDLTLGGASPLGLAFSRSYTSAGAMSKHTMGNGWSHNYDIYLTPTSHGEPGLGLRQPVDAASLVAALYVGFDLLKTKDDMTAWMSASLASKWAIDQVIDNAMVVHIGNKSMEFVKLADGTYAAPPGITSQLIKNVDGTFSLTERFGTHIDFNTNNQASKLTDIDGNTLTFAYNTANNLITVRDAFNRTLTLDYDSGLRVNRVTDSTGRYVTYGYDANNDLITYTDPESKSWAFGYDSNHRLTTLINPLAITTASNTYDTFGRVMTQTVPRQGTTGTATYYFYFSGFRNAEEDPAGNTTTYYYDRKGRECAIEDALGRKSSRQFDGQDHIIQTTDPRSNHTSFLYDGKHNLTQTTDALGMATAFTYDGAFRLTDVTDPLGHLTHTIYNDKHHPTKTTLYPKSGSSVSTTWSYNVKGQLKTNKDGRGVITAMTYDSAGNPATSKTASNPAVAYDYDAVGRMTGLTDQAGAVTTFAYDKRNLLTQKTDPLAKTTRFTYNDAGQLLTKTDRKNKTLTYGYTNSGKLATITYPDSSVTTYTYDQRDYLVGRQDSLGNATFAYDAVGRPTGLTDPNGFTSGYRYDEAGNLTRLTYPDGRTVSYTYDAANRLTTVTIDWLGTTAAYTYDAAGRPTKLSQFNGTVVTNSYDNANRLTGLQNLTAATGGSAIATYAFTLDGNGNRVQSTQETPLAPAVNTDSVDLTYNAAKNRLLTAGGDAFTYDYEGQLRTGYGRTFIFDYEQRLTKYSGAGGGIHLFYYDGAGNRLRVTRLGVTTRYVYDMMGNLIAEADDNNVISRYYIYGAGRLLALATPDNQLYCYHFDATGHTVALTDTGKNMVNKYAYTPFGVMAGEVETIAQPFKYAGQYGVMTEPNGFYYMRARYYDPKSGRFISEDPLGFDGGDVNLYAYVGNNPIMGVDPSGLCMSEAYKGLSFGIMATGVVTTEVAKIVATDVAVAITSSYLGIPFVIDRAITVSTAYGNFIGLGETGTQVSEKINAIKYDMDNERSYQRPIPEIHNFRYGY